VTVSEDSAQALEGDAVFPACHTNGNSPATRVQCN